MKALSFDGALKLVSDAPMPARDGEALVRVICAGICNTDLEIVKGYAGFRGILGHEFVGRVAAAPEDPLVGRRVVGEINAGCGECALCLEGDPRHCASRTVLGIKGRDGAFAEFLSLPAGNLLEVPDSISDEAAVFIEPLAAALSILERVAIESSTEVVLIGDGKLAQLIAMVLAQQGCKFTLIGKHQAKMDLAAELGAACLLADGSIKPEWQTRFDLAIEASGSPTGLESALSLVKPRGTIVLKSTHHAPTALDLSRIVVNEITIAGSRCGRFQPAIDLLASGRVDPVRLITMRLPLDEGLTAFEAARSPDHMKVILHMS